MFDPLAKQKNGLDEDLVTIHVRGGGNEHNL